MLCFSSLDFGFSWLEAGVGRNFGGQLSDGQSRSVCVDSLSRLDPVKAPPVQVYLTTEPNTVTKVTNLAIVGKSTGKYRHKSIIPGDDYHTTPVNPLRRKKALTRRITNEVNTEITTHKP